MGTRSSAQFEKGSCDGIDAVSASERDLDSDPVAGTVFGDEVDLDAGAGRAVVVDIGFVGQPVRRTASQMARDTLPLVDEAGRRAVGEQPGGDRQEQIRLRSDAEAHTSGALGG